MSFVLLDLSQENISGFTYSRGVKKMFIASNDLRKKKVYAIAPYDLEFSKIINVPRVITRKQNWVIDEYIKDELLNADQFDYRYHIVEKKEKEVVVFLTLIKKQKLEETVSKLSAQGIVLEGILSGSFIAFLAKRTIKACWGDSIYLSHNEAPFCWIRKIALNNPNWEQEAEETAKYYNDSIKNQETEDLGSLACDYICNNKYPDMNLLEKSLQIENHYRRYKKLMIFSAAGLALVSALSAFFINKTIRDIDSRIDEIRHEEYRLRSKKAYLDNHHHCFNEKIETINSVNNILTRQNNLRKLMNWLEVNKPNDLIINKIVTSEDNASLLLSGSIKSNNYFLLESYLEVLKSVVNFQEIQEFDIKKSKELTDSYFTIRIKLQENYLI